MKVFFPGELNVRVRALIEVTGIGSAFVFVVFVVALGLELKGFRIVKENSLSGELQKGDMESLLITQH